MTIEAEDEIASPDEAAQDDVVVGTSDKDEFGIDDEETGTEEDKGMANF